MDTTFKSTEIPNSSFLSNIKNHFVDIINSRYGKLMIISTFLLILSYFSRDVQLTLKYDSNNIDYISLGFMFVILSISLITFVILSLALKHISYWLLKKLTLCNSIIYYINELYEHIILVLITICFLSFISYKNCNGCIENDYKVEVYFKDALIIMLITILLFVLLKIWSKKIASNFNYTIYIERIRRCLLEETLISILEMNELEVKDYVRTEYEEITINNDKHNDSNEDNYEIDLEDNNNYIDSKNHKNYIENTETFIINNTFTNDENPFIFVKNPRNSYYENNNSEDYVNDKINTNDEIFKNKKSSLVETIGILNKETDKMKGFFKFIIKDADNPVYKKSQFLISKYCNDTEPIEEDIIKRRILLKEFTSTYKYKNINIYSEKYKKELRLESNNLYKKLSTLNKIMELGDLEKYFSEPLYFINLLKIIKKSKKYLLDKEGIYNIKEHVFREKYFLNKNLIQMNSVIDNVSVFVKIMFILIAFVMLYLKAFSEVDSTSGILSAILGAQIFSNSFSSNAINSLIFLFMIHPYDIGDRVFIKIDGEIENLVVAELNVFSTVFFRWNGTCVYIPNNVLSGLVITNVRRSGIVADSHKIQINSRTDQSKLLNLKSLLEKFLRENPEHYTEYVMVNYEFIENSNKLHMKIYMQYKTNSQNYELYLERKTMFISFLNRCLENLNVDYVLPPQRVILKK
ncbi:mechanosensitive channel of small conductance-like 10 [Vairimorpha apis BRL 01]|uniref:Mechanosensitive channel of small conductance-like 10 n=1 Tax=Vairimorpha apis BRL 01 TaxID=1037528 RepID=T0MFJ1_9MICR|nr:mechanosensitive channel of small conductance-like 10 [Vairimorpha apis BRL 01]